MRRRTPGQKGECEGRQPAGNVISDIVELMACGFTVVRRLGRGSRIKYRLGHIKPIGLCVRNEE